MIEHVGKKEPILGEFYNEKGNLISRIKGGLHNIKRNKQPYFTITNGNGADHERIIKYFPQFQDLVDLHLSDIDGKPMYYVENGWYWLSGAVEGNFGEKYHGGHDKTPFDCLGFFADHCRITYDEAVEILHIVGTAENPKEKFKEILDAMLPRWKQEADDCIKNHNLKIFGEPLS